MASWMVHLRIAENLLAKFPELDESQFAIGNIAPDSGLPDEKWEKFSPPITVTHFCEDVWFSTCSDLEFFRKYLQGLDLNTDTKRSSFLWGYFCHLVTDNLSNEIRESTYQKHKKEFDADKDFVWEVKNDWYGLDHVYVREFPTSLFWRKFVNCVYQADYLDFLPEKNVQARVDYIREFYQRDDEEIHAIINRPFQYLSKAEMDQFVERASQKIITWLKKLQTEPLFFSDRDSVTQG
jgi:hypothetical protein